VLVLSVLVYFLSLDLTVGGAVLAVNARRRGTLNHRELLRRIVSASPWTAAAWLLASGTVLALLTGAEPSGSAAVVPIWPAKGTIPRIVHMLLAALAVAGFAAAYASLVIRREDPVFGRWLARHGLVWFVLCSTMNLPMGGAWLVKLPRPVIERLEGGDAVAMAAISVGVIAAIFALGFGAMAAVVSEPRGYLHATAVSLAITLVTMVVVREQLRPAGAISVEAAHGVAAALLIAGAAGCLWRASKSFVRPRTL
jgi:hypothetical protein